MPAAPAAAAAQAACTWRVTALPAPAGYSHAVANGVASVSGTVVGHAVRADGTGRDAVVWQNGSPQVLPKPPIAGSGSNRADVVNNQGVIAGVWSGTNGVTAWRYRAGTYELLPAPMTMGIAVTGINTAGDIIGSSFMLSGSSQGLLWKAATPAQYTSLGFSTYAVGIDDAGRYVLNTGVIVNPDGSRITLSRQVFVRLYDRGRILTDDLAKKTVVEWNTSGQVVREFSGSYGHAVNTAGVLVATPPGTPYVAVRNGTAWEPFTVRMTTSEGITDGNVIVANYDHDGTTATEQVAGTWQRGC
ncbi:hypothetical protein Daura_21350 [Dactylosporangium aurantiacum]|uniref:Uncharacterized protein n=1 Tax=Dactylosporangium aurantiacum TaxID=35754 RepID=A0A9Q9MMS5_9ACTN|nr:hypothetical protein [Dactylosporangium aurantiacum]UWZ58496.1 hypothetical protein Daura_21350 [Dactylosporangium aurantiacum]